MCEAHPTPQDRGHGSPALSLIHTEVSSMRPPAVSLCTHQHAWWPGPRRCGLRLTHTFGILAPPSPLSPTDRTVSMGAVDRRAEWDLPTGEASSHRSHILHCSLPWTRGLISLGGAVLICRTGRPTHPPLAGLQLGQREAPELIGEWPSGQCASSSASFCPPEML